MRKKGMRRAFPALCGMIGQPHLRTPGAACRVRYDQAVWHVRRKQLDELGLPRGNLCEQLKHDTMRPGRRVARMRRARPPHRSGRPVSRLAGRRLDQCPVVR
jgi:hypothetical protein